MRLLIYLLAMMTGFSAAQAARPVSTTPATLGSAAVVAASVAVVRHKATSAINSNGLAFSISWVSPVAAEDRLAAASPVIRHDLTRQ